jgi:hypothetical protein
MYDIKMINFSIEFKHCCLLLSQKLNFNKGWGTDLIRVKCCNFLHYLHSDMPAILIVKYYPVFPYQM